MFQRKAKQGLQTHMHVASFVDESYDIIRDVLKDGTEKLDI